MSNFEEFLEEQFKLFQETGDKIIANAVAHHRENCYNTNGICEAFYVQAFLKVFEERIDEERKDLEKKNFLFFLNNGPRMN